VCQRVRVRLRDRAGARARVRVRRLAGRPPRALFSCPARRFSDLFVERAVRRTGQFRGVKDFVADRGAQRRARRRFGVFGFVVQFGRQRRRVLAHHEDLVARAFGFFVVGIAGVDGLPGEFARVFARVRVRSRVRAGARERVRDRRLVFFVFRAGAVGLTGVFAFRFIRRAGRRARKFRGVKDFVTDRGGQLRGRRSFGVFGFVV